MKDFFEKCPGKYDLIKIEYDIKKKSVVEKKPEGDVKVLDIEPLKVPDSTLHLKLQVGGQEAVDFKLRD